MGIAKSAAKLLIEEAQKTPFSGSVIQLGRQHFFFSIKDFIRYAKRKGFTLNSDLVEDFDKMDHNRVIDDITFFKLLGFTEVHSLDFSDFENPTFVHDLNNPLSDNIHKNYYNLVYDGGTAEHIFHIPNVLDNIFQLLKEGGRVLHASPSSNHIDHGFYMFSPTLFYDYYHFNGWSQNTFYLFEYTTQHDKKPWRLYNYTPGCLSQVSFGGLSNEYMIGVWVIFTKEIKSTSFAIPQQSYYVGRWKESSENKPVGLSAESFRKKIAKYLHQNPRLQKIIYSIWIQIKKPNFPKKLREI